MGLCLKYVWVYNNANGEKSHFLTLNENHYQLTLRGYTMTTFNLDTALLATTDKKEVKAQEAFVKKTFKAFEKCADSTASACQMLFDNFAHCFDAEIHDKSFNLAKKRWFAAVGFKNAEQMKNETGLNLSAYFSIMAWGAKEGHKAYYDFAELRTDYTNRPKTKASAKPSKAGAGTDKGESDSADPVANIPEVTGLLLEAINKASQLKPDLQNILALEMMEAITKAQDDLKIKKAA